jgi:hypothetical protein
MAQTVRGMKQPRVHSPSAWGAWFYAHSSSFMPDVIKSLVTLHFLLVHFSKWFPLPGCKSVIRVEMVFTTNWPARAYATGEAAAS